MQCDYISEFVMAPGVSIIRVLKRAYIHASFKKSTVHKKTCEDRQALVSGPKLLQHLVMVPCANSKEFRQQKLVGSGADKLKR